MDPTASFVVTARDATAAAIQSADRNLKSLGRTATSLKSMFAGFGVIFSARAFAGWIRGALDANNMTEEQLKATKQAREALDAMREASDSLARSIATALTPAMQGFANVLTGLNAAFLNADPSPFGKLIEDLRDKLSMFEKTHGVDTGIGYRVYSKEDQARIDALKKALDALIEKQNQAFGNRDDVNAIRARIASREGSAAFGQMRRIGDFYDRNPTANRAQVEIEWLPDDDGLEEIIVDAKQRSMDEFMRQMPDWRAAFEPIEEEGAKTAEALGENFRDAFASWLVDGEFQFKDFLKRLAAEFATSQIFSALGGFFAGKTGGFSSFFSDLFGGFRAEGGPLDRGKWYIAGEKGPEPIWGGGPGAFAMGYGGGGGAQIVVNNNLTINGGDDPNRNAALASRAMAESSQKTLAKVKDLIRRRQL